jgi:hypothetical protein
MQKNDDISRFNREQKQGAYDSMNTDSKSLSITHVRVTNYTWAAWWADIPCISNYPWGWNLKFRRAPISLHIYSKWYQSRSLTNSTLFKYNVTEKQKFVSRRWIISIQVTFSYKISENKALLVTACSLHSIKKKVICLASVVWYISLAAILCIEGGNGAIISFTIIFTLID